MSDSALWAGALLWYNIHNWVFHNSGRFFTNLLSQCGQNLQTVSLVYILSLRNPFRLRPKRLDDAANQSTYLFSLKKDLLPEKHYVENLRLQPLLLPYWNYCILTSPKSNSKPNSKAAKSKIVIFVPFDIICMTRVSSLAEINSTKSGWDFTLDYLLFRKWYL